MDEVCGKLAATKRQMQSHCDQGFVASGTHRPAHEQAGEAIDDARSIELALLRPDTRDISDPIRNRSLIPKVALQDVGRYGVRMLAIGGATRCRFWCTLSPARRIKCATRFRPHRKPR